MAEDNIAETLRDKLCEIMGKHTLRHYGLGLTMEIHPRIEGTSCVATQIPFTLPFGAIPSLPESLKEVVHNMNKEAEFIKGIPSYEMAFSLEVEDEIISQGGYVVWDDPEENCPEDILNELLGIKEIIIKDGHRPEGPFTFEDNVAINLYMFAQTMAEREMKRGHPFAMAGLRNLAITAVVMMCDPGKVFGGVKPESIKYNLSTDGKVVKTNKGSVSELFEDEEVNE